MAQRVRITNKQILGPAEMSDLSKLPMDALREYFRRVLYAGFAVFDAAAFKTAATAPASGDVEIPASFGLIDGTIIDVASAQRVHILSGADGVGGWGTGQAAHATLPRISSVFIKYAEQDTTDASKWFIDDSVTPPTSFQQTTKTRTDDYYHIRVVHGTAAASPTAPADQVGYQRIANITVPAAAATIVTGNITTVLPAVSPNPVALGATLAAHKHTGSDGSSQIDHGSLLSRGSKTHAQLDAHVDTVGNPHGTTAAQVGAVPTTAVGAAGGVPSLAFDGYIPDGQISPGITRDSELTAHTDRVDNPHNTTASQVGAIPSTNGAVTDTHIGNRTVTDSTAPSADAGVLTTLLSNIGYMIKAITGKANWRTAPATSLEAAKAHMDATNNPHATTAAQVGAIPAANNAVTDAHIGSRTVTDTTNPTADAGPIATLLSNLAFMVKSITGKANWRTAPATSLEAAKAHMDSTNNPHATTAAQVGAIPSNSGAVSDTFIGNRTIADTTAPAADAGALGTLLSNLAYMIKSITGKGNWRTAPATTLEAAKTHMDTTAASIHGSTPLATANTLVHRDGAGRSKVAAPAQADDIARLDTVTTAQDTAVEEGLIVEAVMAVPNEEPEQVVTGKGPAVQFADGTKQSVTWCRRFPFGSNALKLELLVAADVANTGSFQVRVAYQVNGGAVTNVDATVTPGNTTNFYTADLGIVVPDASVNAGDIVTFTLSRLGADAADTHTGKLQVFHTRLKRG